MHAMQVLLVHKNYGPNRNDSALREASEYDITLDSPIGTGI